MNSVFCIFQLEKSRSRAGLAIPVILAFFLTFTIVGFTFLMKSSLRKKSAGLELLTKIKIDYQLESAICMAFNRIKGNSPRLPIDPSMV
ncbi:hypothetical protein HYY75_12255 [bacterium]|nr:hypothetical protein [bacterium]